MTPEEKVLLEQTLKLSKENNKILLGLRSSARWSTFWSFVRFALIVAPLVLGYLYLEPYLGSFMGTFKNAQDMLQSLR